MSEGWNMSKSTFNMENDRLLIDYYVGDLDTDQKELLWRTVMDGIRA